MLKKILIITTFIFVAISLSAQVAFKAAAPARVAVGQSFRMVYSINADARSFRGPAFNGFSVLSGPNQSTNSSIQIINGKVSKNLELSYTYILQANQEGSFTLPSAKAIVDGEEISSNTTKITVVKGNNQNAAGNNSQSRNNSGGNTTQSGVSNDDVFIKASISNSRPMQGAQIIVTYKIYTRVALANFKVNNASTFQGFWSQNLLDENQRLQQTREYINGEEYISAIIKKVALFPMKSGKIEIEPMDVDVVAQIRSQTKRRSSGDPFFDSFFNDSFFNSSYNNVEKNLKSRPLIVDVQPFPTMNKPAGFEGAVGSFRLNASIDKSALKTNEALTLKYTISGRGNIQLVELPEINFPPDFEVYDPKVNNRISTNDDGVSGTKTFEYLIIPRSAGSFEIPSVSFSFYDVDKKNYVSLKSPEYTIEVEKGNDNGGDVAFKAGNQEDIKYIGSDIRHLKLPPLELVQKGQFFYGTRLFWLFLFAPPIILLISIVLIRSLRKKKGDEALMKNRKANKMARQRLKKATAALKNRQESVFYEEISQALWGYIGDKFNTPLSELSEESIGSILSQYNVPPEAVEKFRKTLIDCDFARFAPGDKAQMMDNIHKSAISSITEIEKNIR